VNSSDKLTIETPEQVELEFKLAGIGSRFLAVLIDSILQGILFFVLALTAGFASPLLSKISPQYWKWEAAFFILFLFCLYWGYFAFFEALWKGQTPGKRLAKIRVIKDTGRAITAYEAIGRNLVRCIDYLPGVYAVGVITMFLNSRQRRIGDFVAGTVVVHERAADEAMPTFSARAQLDQALSTSQLTVPDLQLIEAFLGRRYELDAEVRRAKARQIAEHVARRLKLDGPLPAAEDFLEAVVRKYRDTARFRLS